MTTLVVGLGNPDRGDDAVGLQAARILAGQAPSGVHVVLAPHGLLGLLEQLADCDRLVLVDAVRSGAPPGTVHRIDLDRERLPAPAATSTHGIDVAGALELARTLGWLPTETWFVGLEVGTVEVGAPLSSAVTAAVPALVDAVLAAAAGSRTGGAERSSAGGHRP